MHDTVDGRGDDEIEDREESMGTSGRWSNVPPIVIAAASVVTAAATVAIALIQRGS